MKTRNFKNHDNACFEKNMPIFASFLYGFLETAY